MAYSRRKAKRKFKGVKWIDSPFAREYGRRLYFYRMPIAIQALERAQQIARIQRTPAKTKKAKLKKALLIADHITSFYVALYNNCKTAEQLARAGLKA